MYHIYNNDLLFTFKSLKFEKYLVYLDVYCFNDLTDPGFKDIYKVNFAFLSGLYLPCYQNLFPCRNTLYYFPCSVTVTNNNNFNFTIYYQNT